MRQGPLTRVQPPGPCSGPGAGTGSLQGPEVMLREPIQGSRAWVQARCCLEQAWGPGRGEMVPLGLGGRVLGGPARESEA